MTVGPAATSPAATLFNPTDDAEDAGLKFKVESEDDNSAENASTLLAQFMTPAVSVHTHGV